MLLERTDEVTEASPAPDRHDNPRMSIVRLMMVIGLANGKTYSADELHRFIQWLERVVTPGVYYGYMKFGLSEKACELYHEYLDAFIPDDTVSTPGSVHERLEELLGVRMKHTKNPRTRSCSLVMAKLEFAPIAA